MKELEANNRVLIIAPTSFFSHRGCHIRIYEEIRSLQRKNWDTTVVTYHIGDSLPEIKIKRTINFPWYKKEESGPSWQKIYLDFCVLIVAFFQTIKTKPILLHCHLHEGALIGIILKLFLRKKVVFDSQGSLVDELQSFKFIKKNTLLFRFFYAIEKFIYRYSDEIVVSNKNNQEVLISQFGIPETKISILPDGVRLDEFAQKEIINLELPSNKKTLVYLGTLNKVEGIDDLLEILCELKKQRNDFFLLAMGYPNVDSYKEKAKALGLNDDIFWTGKIEYKKIYSYLSLGDIAVSFKHPTSEGNGKLLNYAAIGLPVICYDHNSNRAILGENGYYIPVEIGIQGKASAFGKYLDNQEDKNKQAGLNNRQHVLKLFDWDNIIENLIKIYAKYDRGN